jgi:hypothetical protein
MKVLVTGGTGLVGYGLQEAVRLDEQENLDDWFFACSKDANLW